MGVKTDHIDQSSTISEFIGHTQTGGQKSLATIPFDNVAAQIEARRGPSYSTLAELQADLGWQVGALARVWGDAAIANRGVYQKSGDVGGGAWTRIGPLPENDISHSLRVPPGEFINPFPAVADRANTVPMFDENGQPVAGPTAGDIVAAEARASEAKTALDTLTKLFLGEFASDALADAHAVSLEVPTGDLVYYVNSGTGGFRYRASGNWSDTGTVYAPVKHDFVGDNTVNAITLPWSAPPGSQSTLNVGRTVWQEGTDYTIVGDQLTPAEAIPLGVPCQVKAWVTSELGSPSASSVDETKFDLARLAQIKTALEIPSASDLATATAKNVEQDGRLGAIEGLTAHYADVAAIPSTGLTVNLSPHLDANGEADLIIDLNLKPNTAGEFFRAQFSNTAGAAWISSGYRYSAHWQHGTAVTYGHSANTDRVLFGTRAASSGGTVITQASQLLLKIRQEGIWLRLHAGTWSNDGNQTSLHSWATLSQAGINAILFFMTGSGTFDLEYTVRKIVRAA